MGKGGGTGERGTRVSELFATKNPNLFDSFGFFFSGGGGGGEGGIIFFFCFFFGGGDGEGGRGGQE